MRLSDRDFHKFKDGARLPVVYKEMGASEIFPHTVAHNANGRFLAVCGDGEYVIYTAMALRNRTFGSALEFVWSQADPNVYAVLESNSTFKVSLHVHDPHFSSFQWNTEYSHTFLVDF